MSFDVKIIDASKVSRVMSLPTVSFHLLSLLCSDLLKREAIGRETLAAITPLFTYTPEMTVALIH